METAEKNGWGKLISYYARKYGEYKEQSPENNLSSQKVSDCILRNMWKSNIPYYYLGKYLEKYTDYNIFCKVFFKMKNKKRRGNHMSNYPKFNNSRQNNSGVPFLKKSKLKKRNWDVPIFEKPKSYEEMSDEEKEALNVDMGF